MFHIALTHFYFATSRLFGAPPLHFMLGHGPDIIHDRGLDNPNTKIKIFSNEVIKKRCHFRCH